jgi:hypothetical protein
VKKGVIVTLFVAVCFNIVFASYALWKSVWFGGYELDGLHTKYSILEKRYKAMAIKLEEAKQALQASKVRCTEAYKAFEMDVWGKE